MNSRRLLVLSALTLVNLTGCDKDGAGSTPAVCTPEHTTVAEGGFCVKLPKDAKTGAPAPNRYSWTWQATEPVRTAYLTLRVVAAEKLPEDVEKSLGTAKPGDTRTKGEFAGGKGKWAMSKSDKGSTVIALVEGPNGVVHCEMAGDGSSKEFDQHLEVCKTIVPL